MTTSQLDRPTTNASKAARAATRVLVVGPLPPPVAGTSVSFQVFCKEIERFSDQVVMEVINSAPRHLGQTRLFTAAHFATARRIVAQFTKGIRRADQALIFSNDQFLFSLVPICLAIAKMAGKPCYVRTFGGSLDKSYETKSAAARWFFRRFMKHADGLIVQTQLLRNYFQRVLGNKVDQVPGYRVEPAGEFESGGPRRKPQANGPLRLVYLSHVREEKGIFVLLESLRRLHEQGESIECDICGPIYDDVADRFQQELSKIPNAKYVGVLKPAEVISTMGQYDALVFPSYYVGEGHPGVLIEAMMAGIPAITTRFRSIPEIVEDGVNGLLVEPQSPDDLARVIRLMANDRGLLNELTENSFRKRNDFTAAELAPRILISMGVPLSREDQ